MGQDIRELLKNDNKIPIGGQLREDHQKRFLSKLEQEFPKKTRKHHFGWMRIAASIAIVLSISVYTYTKSENTTVEENQIVGVDKSESKNATVLLAKQSSPLAEVSPEYKTVENYMLTSIKFELSQIKIDDKNKGLVESFMKRLGNLDKEYQELNRELIEVGPNMQIVEAMMENLRLRLALLNRLKGKLKELEKIENENYTDIQA